MAAGRSRRQRPAPFPQDVFRHPTGFGVGQENEYTRYWIFSNFEVTGGRDGFFIKPDVIVNAQEAMGPSQDFTQIYKSITDAKINLGHVAGSSGDIPIMYNIMAYNNTITRNPANGSTGGFVSSGGYDPTYFNYYDLFSSSGTTRQIHEHLRLVNNITNDNGTSFRDVPFRLHTNTPEDVTEPAQNNADLILESNFIHSNQNASTLIVGNNSDSSFVGCDHFRQTLDEFNACSATWRGVFSVVNYENDTADLFLGPTGADRYLTAADFEVATGVSICDAGKGGMHPYLGTPLPSYVGATNPANNTWVAGLLNDTRSVPWLRDQEGDPAWIEALATPTTACD